MIFLYVLEVRFCLLILFYLLSFEIFPAVMTSDISVAGKMFLNCFEFESLVRLDLDVGGRPSCVHYHDV